MQSHDGRSLFGADGSIDVGVVSGNTWSYSLDGGVSWLTGEGASIRSTDLTEGVNTLQVVQTDADGHRSEATTVTVTLDTSAAAPILTLQDSVDVGGVTTLNAKAGIAISGLEPGAHWEFSTDGSTWTAGQGTSLAATQLPQGASAVQVVQIDAVGNRSEAASVQVMVDTVVGTPTLSDGGIAYNSRLNADGSFSVGKTGDLLISDLEPGATWAYSLDDGATWKTSTGHLLAGADLAEGTYTAQLVQIDAAGNRSKPLTATIIADQSEAAPTLEVTGGVTVDGVMTINADADLHVAGLTPGDTWFLTINGQGSRGQQSEVNTIPVSALHEGINTIDLRQIDGLGNAGQTTGIKIVKDTTALAPTLTVSNDTGTADAHAIDGSGSVNIGGLESGAHWLFSLDGGTTWATGQGTSLTASQLAEGSNTVQVVQIDAVSNRSVAATIQIDKHDAAAAPATFSMTDAQLGAAIFSGDGTDASASHTVLPSLPPVPDLIDTTTPPNAVI